MAFLPVNALDMKERGWDSVDFVLVTGDAYVDHPSFGASIIGRVLESRGYRVGVLALPDWKDKTNFMTFGRPRLGFLVTGGNIDSMVNHYTVAKKPRTKDLYAPGGQGGLRPDRATIVYCQKIREAYKNVPIVIGGLEASLRRLAHYDYWDNKVRRSILIDSSADLLVYGMAEQQMIEIAESLETLPVEEITFIRGTVYKTKQQDRAYDFVTLPDYKEICDDKQKYANSFMIQHDNTDSITAKVLVERYNDVYVVQNVPAPPMTTEQLDAVYGLPYMRTYHPMYEKDGGVPAIEEVRFSLVSSRGCFGGCNFCALTFNQGRVIQARSHKSIVSEAEKMTWEPDFKGYIHDVGGPTANFRQPSCKKQHEHGVCRDRQCLFPTPCKQLVVDHTDYLTLLRKLRDIPKVKKVFVRSGIRYDYLMYDKDDTFFRELCKHHVSGQLKVAPEHISAKVLEKMGKPQKELYERFREKFKQINQKLGMNQFLVPYLMSSHPGSDLKAAVELSEYLRDLGYMPEQVQDFYPTPGTLSTCMYYTGIDPRTNQPVHVPKTPHEKAMQRALIQYRNPKNYELVYEALKQCGREDLIGFSPQCLIRPKHKDAFQKNKEVEKKPAKPVKRKTIRNIHKKKNNG